MDRIGPYHLIRTIGVGGMGEVFLAGLERAGGFYKQVAVKRALPQLMANPDLVAAFEREARLAAALSHRNIVQIFDFGRDDGAIWLAMEYVHGVDLKAVLDAGPLPVGLALEIGVASARALAYAHRATDPRGRALNLVHRDVSPHNVLLSFEGDVKLTDFGLALPEARLADAAGRVQGKYAYMSPEQARGEAVDARADLFALGAVLYEMLSGARCFFADDGTEAILNRVRTAKPCRPLAEVAPHLPAPLVAVVERALALAPGDRFADGSALADALRQAAAAAGVPVGLPALGPWLAAQFPHRARAQSAEPAELTATAGAPIEATAAALAPISAPPSPRRWPLAAGAALLALGGLWLARPPEPSLAPDAGPVVDAAVIIDAAPDAQPVDAAAPDAQPVDAAPPPDARVRRPRRPRRAPPTQAPPAQPATAAPPQRPATTAPPRRPATEAPASGPRLKARGPALTVEGGAPLPSGWRRVSATGLLLRAAAPGGPAVTVRVRARNGRFEATVASKPFGRVLVDGRDLGPTPAGSVPLRPGPRALAVRTPEGETTLRLEVAP